MDVLDAKYDTLYVIRFSVKIAPSKHSAAPIICVLGTLVVCIRDGRFGSKVVQIVPGAPNALKSDLKKPRIFPIWGPI